MPTSQIQYSEKYYDDTYEYRYEKSPPLRACAGKPPKRTPLTDSPRSLPSLLSCRHVVLPADIAKALPKNGRLLTELEWRALGVQQSRGWIHYAIHKPEPHIMLFRRPLNYQQQQQQAARKTVAAM